MLASQNLGRVIWIHGIERPGNVGKKDLLNKLSVKPPLLWYHNSNFQQNRIESCSSF
jgi:hypothetical protein